MKINFKVADYKSDRIVIVRKETGGKHLSQESRRVVVRLFDETTLNRLLEVGSQQTVTRYSKLEKWWKWRGGQSRRQGLAMKDKMFISPHMVKMAERILKKQK